MIERVARAICRSGLVDYMVDRDGDDGAIRWAEARFGSVDGYVDAHWRDHIAGARLAIEAMRHQPGAVGSDPIGRAIGLAMEREGVTNISIGAIWAVQDAFINAALFEERCPGGGEP